MLAFVAPEVLQGTNAYECEVCDKARVKELEGVKAEGAKAREPSSPKSAAPGAAPASAAQHGAGTPEAPLTPRSAAAAAAAAAATAAVAAAARDKGVNASAAVAAAAAGATASAAVRAAGGKGGKGAAEIKPAPAPTRPAWGAPNPAVISAAAPAPPPPPGAGSAVTSTAAGAAPATAAAAATAVVVGAAGGGNGAAAGAPADGAASSTAPAGKVRCDAIKLLQLTQAPPVLTLHLKRFTAQARSVQKVNTHVAFPLTLTLLEQPSGEPSAVVSVALGEPNATSTASSSSSTNPTEWAQLDPALARARHFELFGVVEHSGTYRDGHYTAYVRSDVSDGTSASGARWNIFSDAKVTPVSEAAVLSAQAFLLFYMQVDGPRAPQPQRKAG